MANWLFSGREFLHKFVLQPRSFWRETLWMLPLEKNRPFKTSAVRGLRLFYWVAKGFKDHNLQVHAASLTFTSLMSLVPLVAISLAVLKGLGFHLEFIEQVRGLLSAWPEQIQQVFEETIRLVEKTNFAKMGGVGALFLIFMAVSVLNRIETAFNHIWERQKPRGWVRRVTNYISIIVVVPILFLAAMTAMAQIKWNAGLIGELGLFKFAVFAAFWLAFAFLYQFMPNAAVRIGPSLVSGFIAALLWQGWFRLFITLQPGVTRYNVIYGTLAFLPIFLAWLYTSWIIVLLCAEITFALQNEKTFLSERQRGQANALGRAATALAILEMANRAFHDKGELLTTERFANAYHASPRLLGPLMKLLCERGWLAPHGQVDSGFVLLKDPGQIPLAEVIRAVLTQDPGQGGLNLQVFGPQIGAILEKLNQGMDGQLASTTVKSLGMDKNGKTNTQNAAPMGP